jgi:hypothetical protein
MIEIQDSAHFIHILKVFEVSLLKLFNHSQILIMYGIYLKNKTISIMSMSLATYLKRPT